MFKIRKELWLIVIALALLAGVFAPVSQAGSRLTATLDEPFEVDGKLYPAGKLILREVRAYSPVATLTEVRVDGESLGLLLAQNTSDSTPATSNELIFARNANGHLVLVSVAREGEPVRKLSSFGAPAPATDRSLLMAAAK